MQPGNVIVDKYNGKFEWRVNNYYLDDKTSKQVISEVKFNSNIDSFYCYNNILTVEGIANISTFIKANKNFQHIYFLDNQINDQQASTMANILKYSPNIASVSFINYDITTVGATAIANAFKNYAADIKIQLIQGPPIHRGLPNLKVELSVLNAIKYSSSIIYYNPPERYHNDEAEIGGGDLNILLNVQHQFVTQIITNTNKFIENCAKVNADMVLTTREYGILYSQLSFCISQPFLAPKCDLNFSFVMNKFNEKFFLFTGICNDANPFGTRYNIPMEISCYIMKHLSLHDIVHQKKENTGQLGV